MATIDVRTAQQQQRKANQQIARAATQGRRVDPERLAAIAAANKGAVVRVLPRDPAIRKYLKHQPSGVGFRDEGSIEWPLDKFTMRRLRDGDVTVELQDVEVPAQQAPVRGRATMKE